MGQEEGGCVADEAIHGYPSKSFFVDMLTRDIKVSDSILDLMDNSVDSAVSRSGVDVMTLLRGESVGKPLGEYLISLEYGEERFRLVDNCGGITLEDARDRVFLMGNPRASAAKGGLSVYGIGMKRAFFKLGNKIAFDSQTEDRYFELNIDVRAWHDQGDDKWDFGIPKTGTARDGRSAGTEILIEELDEDVALHFALTAFVEDLEQRIASTYALFLEAGLRVTVNGRAIGSALPDIGGENVTPARAEFSFKGVDVLVVAGVTPKRDRVQRGTYVFCNGRMVLDTDRSRLTGWGDLLPQWHTKFGHFVGYLYFESDDVTLLPWTTTKQGVVYESAVYQKALNELEIQAHPVLSFLTKVYPGEVEEAGIPERDALAKVGSIKITEVHPGNAVFHVELPKPKPEHRQINIEFKKQAKDVDRIKKCIPHLKSNKDVGSYAFDYLLKKECQ